MSRRTPAVLITGLLLSGLAITGCIAGCTDQQRQEPTPTSPVESSSRISAPAVSEGTEPPTKAPGPDWTSLISGHWQLEFATAGAGWLIVAERHPARSVLRAINESNGATWGLATDPGWHIDSATPTEDALYVVEFNEGTAEARITRGTPGDGPELVQTYRRYVPELVVIGGEVYATALTGEPPSLAACLKPVDDDTKPAVCMDGGIERIQHIGNIVSFTSYATTEDTCADIYWLDTTGALQPQLAETHGCPFAGVAGPDAAAWTETVTEDDRGGLTVFAAEVMIGTGTQAVNVGTGTSGSVRGCGGDFYWNKLDSSGGAQESTLRRWRQGTVESIWTAPMDADYPTIISEIECLEDGSLLAMTQGGNPQTSHVLSTNPTLAGVAEKIPDVSVFRHDGTSLKLSLGQAPPK